MGVKGLWELLHPVARPIKLENLSNKYLAIDASIWLHQFLRGMRDKEGQVMGNAHIIGFFRRICKLLYYDIKPIFIFDGGTPALKRLTIQERRRRKKHDANMVKRTAEKLLAAQLRLRALEQRKATRKKKTRDKESKQDEAIHDSDKDPMYLQELQNGDLSPEERAVMISAIKPGIDAAVTSGSQAKRNKDKYLLPPMEVDFDTLSKIRSNDERFGYDIDDDVSRFLNEFKKEDGVANIDSDVFKALPSEMQYEILHDIRLRSRVTSYERVQDMVRSSNTPMDFSKLQIQGVIRRNNVTHKLLTVNQAVNKMDEVAKPGRIASQRNRQYVLIKNEDGGWVLGGRKPTTGATADKPVQLDSDEDEDKDNIEIKDEDGWESESEEDNDVEFEEVKISRVEPTIKSEEPINAIAPKKTVDINDSNLLINHLEAYVDEDESIEKVMAKFAEVENEAARKLSADPIPTRPGDGFPGSLDEESGQQLVGEKDTVQIQDATSRHLVGRDLRLKKDHHWSEALTGTEEIESMDTVHSLDAQYSDNAADYDDTAEMIEDEQTGDIVTRKVYNTRRQGGAYEPGRRALPITEEAELDNQAFHGYWTGYTPDCFKIKHEDYESKIRSSIYEWNEETIRVEVHSATRKLEKSSVNDTVGVEALKFWKAFLESLLHRLQARRVHIAQNVPVNSSTGLTIERKSRLSRTILLEDDDDDGNNIDNLKRVSAEDEPMRRQKSATPISPADVGSILTPTIANESSLSLIANQENPETMILSTEQKVPLELPTISQRPILDFSSSILKRRVPSIISDEVEIGTCAEDSIVKPASEVYFEPLEDSVKEASVEEETTMGPVIEASTSSSALESENKSTIEVHSEPVSDEMDNKLAEDTLVERRETSPLPDKEVEEISSNLVLAGELDNEEEEDKDEDEAHEMNLEDEEQNFTKLFPDMANLPGVVNPREASPIASAVESSQLTLSVEEKEALDQQEAKKMFEETRRLESEIKVLRDQHRKHQRDADDLTEGMVAETQMLLRLFGIPYLVAPMEAEAQCADLQLRGVVDGILTEDSDVFLFGGARVFKNMFREEKFVECYLMSDIERDLGVGRDRLVALAYLLGSDYTAGIKGIGLITAMEIIRLFPKLENFARWWRGEQYKMEGVGDANKGDSDGGLTEMELDSIDEVALEKLAKQCRKIHIPPTFPDPHVAEAYIHPLVDDDPAKFQWGIPDLDGLRDFLRKSLGWDRSEVDRVLLPIIRQMSSKQHQTQTSLDSFFDASVGTGGFQSPARKIVHKSTRLKKVVDRLTGHDLQNEGKGDNKPIKKPSTKRKSTTSEKDKSPASTNSEDVVNDSEVTKQVANNNMCDEDNVDDDEEGFVDELEKKKRRTSRSKGIRSTQTKVPEAVVAAKRQLQSKNVNVKLAERKRNHAAITKAPLASKATSTNTENNNDEHIINSKRAKQGSDTEDSGSDEDQDNSTLSHWDLLAEQQRKRLSQDQDQDQEREQSPRKGNTAFGVASSLTAMVSASNVARYGSSFRNKETGGDGSKSGKRTAQGVKKGRVSKR
ncbi:DNA repair protein rad2 [Lobosporangium transversale]|uniref:PIN domain-like protein n=1 Tax=Lobosporangium transversale TaxID=64571 RepID=A0A1Y2G9X2_9FUNG|nr:hypothetical protein BCR41DRAFT_425617 [Lobosporangium transversale]KAF9919183.1 DNA repair protein rad2 [Lobosporangium transversale]ORZ05154.1 hypothetical protein BCR41DRAFT_425617 [Lobosporangium transversale]|eukprot:XP_021876929.1 hypothetical protein BCR41DRAFT_425617 [Lobosporangium transversale]